MPRVAICSFILFTCATALAQADLTPERNDQTVQGRVTDSFGAMIPGVTVRAKRPNSRFARAVVTNESGFYVLSGLSAGPFVISAELPGFLTGNRQVDIEPKRDAFVIDFELAVQPTSDSPSVISSGVDSRDLVRNSRQRYAEFLVEQLWGLPLQLRRGTGAESVQPSERQRTLTKRLHELDTDAVAALLLALKEPDLQLRRNAALMLLDLAGGFSVEARPSLKMPEALPALTDAQADNDPMVRAWAEQAIREIRSQGIR
jgi:hypothetical protein